MPIPNTNASHDFIFAKLHGLWANAVRGDTLERLLRSGTPDALQRNLHDIGLDSAKREDFHRNLFMREFGLLERIARLLDDASADYYHALLSRAYFEDLKTVMHYRFFPEHNVGIKEMIVGLPCFPFGDVSELIKTESPSDFLDRLPCFCGMTRDRMEKAMTDLEKTHDIMAAECFMDQAHYDYVKEKAKAAPAALHSAAEEMTAIEIDIENICMLLRNIRTYHLKAERMEAFWLKGGKLLHVHALSAMLKASDVRSAVAELPAVYQKLLSPFTEAELYLSENALWNHLYDKALKLFRDFENPSLSIVAFPFLLHFETQNIRRIYEGVRFGIPARDMQDMMIGA